MQFAYIDVKKSSNLKKIIHFLSLCDLNFDTQIEQFVVAYNDNDEIIAGGGISGNIIKCVAINEECRGEGVALQLATELVNLAYELGRTHLFIYTKPEYEILFKSCGFYTVATAYPNVVLLENSATRLRKYCNKLAQKYIQGEKIGAIVMNANPFTLGHDYLIQQALLACDHLHLFVVSENASLFSYSERFELVKQGIAQQKNITLHAGSDYIISRATFPNYFLKDKGLTDNLYVELDLKLFRHYIAPSLGITHRFVGSEPICAVTHQYNQKMHYWLEQADLSAPPIQVIELERQYYAGEPISASQVRQLLKEGNWKLLSHLLPASTYRYLEKTYGGKSLDFPVWINGEHTDLLNHKGKRNENN
ncbi:TPA: [citrate (pro-3S)-lyase] ligase [Pasteurella multocida]